MDSSPPPDEELGTSQIIWSPDLDACWRQLRRHITPYEKDRSAYHSSKYQKPVFVFMNPSVWRRLVERQGSCRAVDLMLMMGFAPAPEGPANIAEWIEQDAPSVARVPTISSFTTNTTNTTTTTTVTTTSASTVIGGSGVITVGSKISFIVPSGNNEESRMINGNASYTNGGIRFWVLNHEDSRPSTTGSPVSQYMSPRHAGLGIRPSSLASFTTTTTPYPPTATTTTGTCNNSGGFSVAAVAVATNNYASAAAINNNSNNINNNGITIYNGVISSDKDVTSARIRNIETDVKETPRQVRILKSRESDRDVSVASDVASQHESSQPHIIVRPDRPFVASTTCHALVCLPVNYLDPDCAPYVVSLATCTGRKLLGCTIVEHRYVIFVAPPHRRGLLALVLLCTREGTLWPYAREVWLEYRAQDPPNTLTHHAVNQLLEEIPLPSSATAVDPNPSEMEQPKSESAFEDDNTFCDTDTALSTSDHGLETEPHLPLTKEMLELIPNGFITTGLGAPRTVATSQIQVNDGTLSAAESETSSGGAAPSRLVPTSQLWNDTREVKQSGSPTMSIGQPTSYPRGQQSGYSDEDTTQIAFNYTTNPTELSSSTATSVMSFESTAPHGIFGAGNIMASRGWVRHRPQGGKSPTGSQTRGFNPHPNSSFTTVTTAMDE